MLMLNSLVRGNREIVDRFERKQVWGESLSGFVFIARAVMGTWVIVPQSSFTYFHRRLLSCRNRFFISLSA